MSCKKVSSEKKSEISVYLILYKYHLNKVQTTLISSNTEPYGTPHVPVSVTHI